MRFPRFWDMKFVKVHNILHFVMVNCSFKGFDDKYESKDISFTKLCQIIVMYSKNYSDLEQ